MPLLLELISCIRIKTFYWELVVAYFYAHYAVHVFQVSSAVWVECFRLFHENYEGTLKFRC